MSALTETYKGAKIRYDERKNKWIVSIDGTQVSCRDSLVNARSEVDGLDKVQKDFDRHSALYCEGFDSASIIPCTVTSYMMDTREVWISFVSQRGSLPSSPKKPTRAKVSFNRLYQDTPENQEKLNQIRALTDAADSLDKKIHSIGESLTPYKIRK
jgi:hypothetical protein